MKKVLVTGLLAVGALALACQQASAWTNSRFSVGLSWDLQSGGNSLLWGLWRNGQPPGYDHPHPHHNKGGYAQPIYVTEAPHHSYAQPAPIYAQQPAPVYAQPAPQPAPFQPAPVQPFQPAPLPPVQPFQPAPIAPVQPTPHTPHAPHTPAAPIYLPPAPANYSASTSYHQQVQYAPAFQFATYPRYYLYR